MQLTHYFKCGLISVGLLVAMPLAAEPPITPEDFLALDESDARAAIESMSIDQRLQLVSAVYARATHSTRPASLVPEQAVSGTALTLSAVIGHAEDGTLGPLDKMPTDDWIAIIAQARTGTGMKVPQSQSVQTPTGNGE